MDSCPTVHGTTLLYLPVPAPQLLRLGRRFAFTLSLPRVSYSVVRKQQCEYKLQSAKCTCSSYLMTRHAFSRQGEPLTNGKFSKQKSLLALHA